MVRTLEAPAVFPHLTHPAPSNGPRTVDLTGPCWTSARTPACDALSGDRTVDVHVARLRRKLAMPLLETVRGVGYRLSPGADLLLPLTRCPALHMINFTGGNVKHHFTSQPIEVITKPSAARRLRQGS